MNSSYENKYGCIEIVKNTLDNVSHGAICDANIDNVYLRSQALDYLKNQRLKTYQNLLS